MYKWHMEEGGRNERGDDDEQEEGSWKERVRLEWPKDNKKRIGGLEMDGMNKKEEEEGQNLKTNQ
ncbi:hypothetical protein OUZ56_001408 [Daphnia magna]|uniref:Uncharacterized protein n=1 Tax=Daphnia magna TaxID=35525 RepID=A0ABR0A2J4_9CRUS|nr:hypothetical protein OUZ56_001408 [Daphnia magna]